MKRSPRYLRIAFSATCVIACVLLIALWARSYRFNDIITRSDARGFRTLGSNSGGLYLINKLWPGNVRHGWMFSNARVRPSNSQERLLRAVEPNTVLAFENGLIDTNHVKHVLGFGASHYLQTFYEIPVWF